MARRHGRPWTWTVWVAVLAVGFATWALQVPVRAQLADDPVVGGGRLDRPPTAAPPAPVLDPLPDGADPVTPAALTAALDAVPREGLDQVAGLVVDARTGQELYRTGSGARTPASSLKVLTALVAVDVLGPDRVFSTSALLAPDGGTVVLRGAGDPLLVSTPQESYPHAPALSQLADDTAAALKGRGVTSVALAWDASLFGQPAWNPEWPDIFARSVAPITALTVDHGRPNPGVEDRTGDPAALAGERFAQLLTDRGITVTGRGAGATPSGATELAHLDSLPVGVIAEQVLANSDNDAAETLLWHTALATGHEATPTGGASALQEQLRARGLWSEGMVVRDGNGIAEANAVTPDALVGAVRLSLADPRLSTVVTGLPVAGVDGTLVDRFEVPGSLSGRGVVRAKTGTIRGHNTLTGYLVTADGQPLVFAFMLSGGAGQTSARAWLDRASATLASCGC